MDTANNIDEAKLQAFVGRVVGDFGAALSSTLDYMGDKLGLYKAMATSDPVTPAELAGMTGTIERYVREWLINQAAGGYVEYDPLAQRYRLPPEQAVALADESSPFFVGGGFYVVKAMMRAEPRILEAFRKGGGMPWGEHDPDLFVGTERFFRPGYTAYLIGSWIPSLAGTLARLEAGINVTDIGCGHGASTIIMAKAFPRSRFFGFDAHAPSIDAARKAAAAVADRVTFDVADAISFPNHSYALIAFFDCLHDMADPVGGTGRACQTLAKEGTVMIVEPMAGDSVEENFNPVGRVFSAASTLCCTPNSLHFGGRGLGAVATEQVLREVALEGGLKQFRRATQTPFNRVFEARR